MRRTWTASQEEWLREHYPDHANDEIARMFSEAFPDAEPKTVKAVSSRAKRLGLRKREGWVRNPPRFWTEEKRAWFRGFVPGHTEGEISAEHERIYGTPLTEAQIGNAKTKLGVKSGTHGGRFEKGQEPHNKGKTWADYGTPEGHERSRATCFKPGVMPRNADGKPVGTERVDTKDGYVWVKIAERKSDPKSAHDNWRLKHHLVYEAHHGAIPEGCNVVFADRDNRNFNPENLVAVPRSLWSVMAHRHMMFHDRESLEACMNIAKLDKAVHKARCAPRECRVCGHEFAPRYPHQRTCDACLAARRGKARP